MVSITSDTWRQLPPRADAYAELSAEPIGSTGDAFLAVDHDAVRHLLLPVPAETDPINDERSRGIRALSRRLSVQGQPERQFIDLSCTTVAGHDVFNLVVTAVLEQRERSGDPSEAVLGTLARWRGFWNAAPDSGLTRQEIHGLFGELWFLVSWLLPRGHNQVGHWVGPTGARHDFQWPGLAVESKATTSVRGHVHHINGIDQLDPPADGRLCLFSLRLREEASGSESIVTLIDRILSQLENSSDAADSFEMHLAQTGYSPIEAERYSDLRFRIISERLYEVSDSVPRISATSFSAGLPPGIERVEYEINLDVCPNAIVAGSPSEFEPPQPESRP
ncbi:MAG: PD-(D/E)XK motif protein [Acidimicrobiales bacterium]